MNFEKNPGVGY